MIHPTAIIDTDAVLGQSVKIGPYCVVGPGVVLGDDVVLKSHVVIRGPSKIGRGVQIYQFATVGEDTPALAYEGEDSVLEVGEGTIIREGVTIHRGMAKRGIRPAWLLELFSCHLLLALALILSSRASGFFELQPFREL